MTYDLAIGDRSYSSWSLRGWLLFEKFGLPVKCHTGILYTDDFQRLLAEFQPARLVPAMRTPEGEVIGDTLAIAETLAERHPDAGIWPNDPAARAMARYICAEMHSGFTALRGDCAMNLRLSYADSQPRPEVLDDLARIEAIWARARDRFGADSPWLFGRYTAADAFFAPVATRIATYNLPVSPDAMAYVTAHLADPAFRRWRAMGAAESWSSKAMRNPMPNALGPARPPWRQALPKARRKTTPAPIPASR